MAERLVAALVQRGETVATVESLTGGLVAGAITDVAGCSAVFRGGLVTYATDLKNSLARVPVAVTDGGVVTEATAFGMADGARAVCGADWALATTGVAGPGPQDGIAAGTVWVAVVGPAGQRRSRLLHGDGDRDAVRATSVSAVLALALEAMTGSDGWKDDRH